MKKLLLTVLFVSFLNVKAQTPIQEFNFNGTLNNTANTISFIGTNNFVTDRAGVLKGAQRLNNKALEAVIDNLPQGKSSRTISIWVKFNDISNANYIWGYGNPLNAQYCGLLQQGTTSSDSDLSLAAWGASNDVIVSTPLEKNIWYNYTITYEGANSKIYRDGKLLKYLDGMTRSTNGNIFRLGEINTMVGINADIDDLKIYNIALTTDQVRALYDSEMTSDLLTTASVKVKTANETIVAPNEVNGTVKSVEVYSQGQKIMGSNATNIADLPEGTYLLKITSTPLKKITSK
ncbi:LamG-like jellyroll fold domain-containing protein [Flavobacterium nitrogenifigens]|uniref:Concanavalin A-like lectin/glucanases superfamily protein n=1 Tax=Flavobacterium nitrogenifigens TaxID=1617283 RepID=A0A521AY22_9FLAO|nr:LamG-like jellyroll fold domain-containing protein [Flavobacterium nitrogenifigens]KAF2329156.1 LamG domain-containing protein [Flavobacterium nitrogenifigens]SMO39715.1 Concanavalin A-like lectin/glucanases superfamily protein [Flavobacterium nitrogenifigens]